MDLIEFVLTGLGTILSISASSFNPDFGKFTGRV
jgi:hypothetical protein